MALEAAIIVGVLALIGLVLFGIEHWRMKHQKR